MDDKLLVLKAMEENLLNLSKTNMDKSKNAEDRIYFEAQYNAHETTLRYINELLAI